MAIHTEKPSEDRSSRRWIRKRIDQLDAERDYAEIVKLSTAYYLNQFQGDWAFAQSMPRFNIGPSATAIYRAGRGKLHTNSDRRADDTTSHFLTWVEYGPESPQVKRSVDIINALHAKWAKEYPAEFEDPDLWTYVIAWEVCGTPVLLRDRLGFPEPSEKEKTAAVIFGKKLAELFVYVDGRPLPEVMPALDTYEEWADFVRAYEARPWEYDSATEECVTQVLEIFERRFSLPFRSFARALVTSFWHDGMFRCARVARPGRFISGAARAYMKVVLSVGRILPDPKITFSEKLKRKAAQTGEPLNPILKSTQVDVEPVAGQCPMGFGGGATALR
ncbi:oxygenase MpaB family protein [Streptomyces justiciae]|uniref:oxygenase MpaB family protein n=1 Tax=Streptomyces justiciae TaxID=2780140 RepID=UPI0021183F7E|nr:oxygenase MpaB family protein [Streptomyces justiciae]MCW8378643.1 oxygenase MpaB family protein [Streptomyces justiciae]